MALSAADLQKRHNLEGAPDPFPSLATESPVKARSSNGPQQLDTGSHAAFPSLASSGSPNPATNAASNGSAWSTFIKPTAKAPVFTDTFTLGQIELSAGRDGKTPTLGEVLRQVMTKHKVKIDASANSKSRQTTFYIKGDSQKDLDKAKRSLLAGLSPVVTLTVNAPLSTIPSIIGSKGANLKQIRDLTNVQINIPPRDSTSAPQNGQSNDHTDGDVEEEEPTAPITITGPNVLAYEAQSMINNIIASKTSTTSQRIKDIEPHVLPFIIARRPLFIQAAQGGDIHLALHAEERAITVSGDREAVTRVAETIRSTIEAVKGSITSLKISLPKRQHRLLAGKAIDDIMIKSKCTVITAPAEDASDEIAVWGNPADLPSGLTAVMETANAAYIHEFPLPGPFPLSKQLLSYLINIDYAKTLSFTHPDVTVYTPNINAIERGGSVCLDIVGEQKSTVDPVVRQVSEIIGKLIGATRDLTIDWLVHKTITGKNAKKIRQFHDAHNVSVFFPPEENESNTVLLVYDPLTPDASPIPDEKSRHLDEVAAELLKFVKDAGEVKSETITVEKKWHDAVLGTNRTTLNAIIGEEKALSIKLGSEAKIDGSEDVILVRGASADVGRAVKEILETVQKAKNDQIDNSHVLEFEIDREYVGRIVGSQGAGIGKLKDQLGVRVDISDATDDKEVVVKKKKGAAPPQGKSKVKITGREENVREAKKRIIAQLERLADETTEVLKIPAHYHAGLIGQSGKYAIRLEEKYGVKITFPRHSHNNENGEARGPPLKADEVMIKGGKKGVAHAKSEIMEAVEFEKENDNSITFTVPTRAVARILGKGGASINEIKDETSTQIDIEKAWDDNPSTNITVRGSKKNIAEAKTAILAISDQVGEETTEIIYIDSKFHRTIIGGGGSGLRELVEKVGGPKDSKAQAGLVRFPRPGEAQSDEVRLRGEPKLVAKLKAELEKTVQELQDRVVLAVEIPSAQHRALIGRGGQHLNDFQSKHNVQVQFPGSRGYENTEYYENTSDVEGADPANIVKVSGRRKAAEAAVADLKSKVKAPPAETATTVVEVPLKYHHFVSKQGAFFRELRTLGVQVDQSGYPNKSAIPPRPPATTDARIDDQEEAPQVQWEVTENYVDSEDGVSTWTLRGKDEAALENAKEAIDKAVKHAEAMSHVGFLTLPDRTHFPRIVGSKGANVSRLRNETGAEITVGKEDSVIVIIGSEADILAAKDAILKMITEGPARGGRRQK